MHFEWSVVEAKIIARLTGFRHEVEFVRIKQLSTESNQLLLTADQLSKWRLADELDRGGGKQRGTQSCTVETLAHRSTWAGGSPVATPG